jgi:hypothetical protein
MNYMAKLVSALVVLLGAVAPAMSHTPCDDVVQRFFVCGRAYTIWFDTPQGWRPSSPKDERQGGMADLINCDAALAGPVRLTVIVFEKVPGRWQTFEDYVDNTRRSLTELKSSAQLTLEPPLRTGDSRRAAVMTLTTGTGGGLVDAMVDEGDSLVLIRVECRGCDVRPHMRTFEALVHSYRRAAVTCD